MDKFVEELENRGIIADISNAIADNHKISGKDEVTKAEVELLVRISVMTNEYLGHMLVTEAISTVSDSVLDKVSKTVLLKNEQNHSADTYSNEISKVIEESIMNIARIIFGNRKDN